MAAIQIHLNIFESKKQVPLLIVLCIYCSYMCLCKMLAQEHRVLGHIDVIKHLRN